LVCNVLAVVGVLAGVAMVLWYWPQLPATIPTHFNAAGEADGWGSKGMLWMLPGISVVLVAGMLALQRVPWIANTPIAIDETNAQRQYGLIVRLLSVLGLCVSAIFLLIVIETIVVALGGQGPMGAWMLPVLIVPTIGGIVWYFVAALRSPPSVSAHGVDDADQLSSDA
jgi:uncharacterized membrane protein